MGNKQSKGKKNAPAAKTASERTGPTYSALMQEKNAATRQVKVLESKIEQLASVESDKADVAKTEPVLPRPTVANQSQSTNRHEPSVLHSQRPDRVDGAPPDSLVRIRRRRKPKSTGWRKWAQKSVASLFQF